jgi:phosphinothricin acetyltransferase
MAIRVTEAEESHLPGIASIYEEAALTTHVTFDLEGRPVEAWRAMLERSDEGAGRMLLVALDEQSGAVLGYASSGPHKDRRAYDTTCETSVYVASAGRRRGVGGVLYDELLSRLDASPLRLAVGGVALPNDASVRLHLSRGFAEVGTFRDVGWKLGRTWDVTWYERPLAAPALVAEIERIVGGGGAARGEGVAEAILQELPGADRIALLDDTGHELAAAGDRSAETRFEVPVVDPATALTLGEIVATGALGDGDRLLLQWCAEAARPLWSG